MGRPSRFVSAFFKPRFLQTALSSNRALFKHYVERKITLMTTKHLTKVHQLRAHGLFVGAAALAALAAGCSDNSGADGVVAVESISVDPIFDQDESIYEEIVAEIDAMGALDRNGHMNQ